MALVGSNVVLSGLKREDLNGSRGLAVSFDAERDRYSVSGVVDGSVMSPRQSGSGVPLPTGVRVS